eukprot:gene39279-51754_t
MRKEENYIKWRKRIKDQRENMKEKFTPIVNSLEIKVSGITPRAGGMQTPRGGQLYSWGVGAAGRLGLDVTEQGDPQKDVDKPRVVQSLIGIPILKISCGYSHSGAVASGGDLYLWGSAASGKCGLGESVKAQDCFCSIPTVISLGQGIRARKVACGSMHTAVVTEAGQLYVFGCGDGGRLGLGWGRRDTVYVPRLVECVLHERLSSVSCGNSSTIVVTEIRQDWQGDTETRYRAVTGGKVYIAGSGNVFGQFYEEFTLLKSMEKYPIKQVAAGYQHSVLLTADGEVYSWGNNKGICCGHSPHVHFVEHPTRMACLYQGVRNLSIGCTAEQSSTYNNREATAACNGDKSGFGIRKVTSTQQDPQGWWEVDLGQMALIDEIRVWNRTDVPLDPSAPRDQYTSRLFPFWAMVGVHPFVKDTGADSLQSSLQDAIARTKFTEASRCSKWRCP